MASISSLRDLIATSRFSSLSLTALRRTSRFSSDCFITADCSSTCLRATWVSDLTVSSVSVAESNWDVRARLSRSSSVAVGVPRSGATYF